MNLPNSFTLLSFFFLLTHCGEAKNERLKSSIQISFRAPNQGNQLSLSSANNLIVSAYIINLDCNGLSNDQILTKSSTLELYEDTEGCSPRLTSFTTNGTTYLGTFSVLSTMQEGDSTLFTAGLKSVSILYSSGFKKDGQDGKVEKNDRIIFSLRDIEATTGNDIHYGE